MKSRPYEGGISVPKNKRGLSTYTLQILLAGGVVIRGYVALGKLADLSEP